MKRWILPFAFGLTLSAWFVFVHDSQSLEPFRMSFLTVIFTVTTFSVTFAISGFNAAAYRQFHRTLAPRLLFGCVVLVVFAFVPLGVLVAKPAYFVTTCLLILPSLMLSSALMQEVVRQETDPLTLLDRTCSLKSIHAHLAVCAVQVKRRIEETEALELSKPGDRPTHEFDWHLPIPNIRDDPLVNLSTLGLLTIQQGDLHSFVRVMERFLEVVDCLEKVTIPPDERRQYRLRQELRELVYGVVERITLALQKDRGTIALCRVAIDTLGEYAVAKVANREQTSKEVFWALALMKTLGTHCYESGASVEIRSTLIVARQLVQKGMDDPPKSEKEGEFDAKLADFFHTLPQLTNVIKRVGSYAIKKDDSELLYRCFDAFGWLGCAAVKSDFKMVGIACLRAIAQLGREARAKKMECFDPHCPLRPEQHAEERIEWIASWLSKKSLEEAKAWVGLIEGAISRLNGKEVEIKLTQNEKGEVQLNAALTGKNHVEEYAMQGGSRTVDYADFTFLKDLELHAFRGGIMMQGPVVPIFPEKNEAETGDPQKAPEGETYNTIT
ncbi:hypothetical protein OH491_01705 [Termitidicoccus mucosus]|uniref:Uncharacterized protein n=1 Tax=Termitidicoccus mucosus TaxID=1184151 RepID=A0A178IKH2_9BACT|nr:hypothetical protein AW736_07850 [Opitutaceae bacterium TSB47]